MKKMSIWVLVVSMILGSGFVAMAAETECIPPCQGNLETFRKTVDVKLTVAPWVELEFIRENGNSISVCYSDPKQGLSGIKDVLFLGRSNVPVSLQFQSMGFQPLEDDALTLLADTNGGRDINELISYYVSMYGTWENFQWPEEEALALATTVTNKGSLPAGGGPLVVSLESGEFWRKWHGHVTAGGSRNYGYWEEYDAGKYGDTVTITVATP